MTTATIAATMRERNNMELVWLVETQHVESGDTTVELVASGIDLREYIWQSFTNVDALWQLEVVLVVNDGDTRREYSVIDDGEEYYVTATLHNVKVAP